MKKLQLLIIMIGIANVVLAQTMITFCVENIPKINHAKVGVRGNEQPLSWEKTLFLKEQNGKYVGECKLDHDLSFFEYKYIIEGEEDKNTFELEGQENRIGVINGSAKLALVDIWNVPPIYDLRNLPLLSVKQLKQDADILAKALWQIHPGIERYQDSMTYFSNVELLLQSFNQPIGFTIAYKEISKFVATIQCGHTFASPFNQTGFINNIILNQPDKLPFGIEWLDERLFITKNATDNSIFTKGTEITSINGISTKDLSEQLLKLTKGDGSSHAKRFQDLNVIGYDYYEMFDVYFPLIIQPKNDSFQLSIISNNEELSTHIIHAVKRNDRNKILQVRYKTIPKNIEDTWEHRILANNIGYLKLGTFAIWGFKMDWKTFLNETFDDFSSRNVKKIIIDIRGNEGGADEVLEELMQYLLKKPCTATTFEERIRYSSVPNDLKPYLFTWDESIYDFNGRVKRNNKNSFSFVNGNDQTITYKASDKAFNGEITLLVNAANSSATFYMAKIFKDCSLGKLAGETTGGSKKGINGGNVFFLRLPNSKIEIDIPVFGQFNENEKDEGIVPDFYLKRSLADIKNGTDSQLERLIYMLTQ